MVTQNRNRKDDAVGRRLYKLLFTQVPLGKTLESKRSFSFAAMILFAAFCILVVVSAHYLGLVKGILFAIVFSVIAIVILIDSVNRSKRSRGFRIKGFHGDD
ncbi:MAG: hypothetical protein AB2551_16390 [Candidatus Thiodiazotropha sp.]